MLIKLFIPSTVVSYTCHPQPLQQAWSKPWMLAASHRERWCGLSMLLFCVYSRASIHTEACPLRQLRGFDSMEWEGPPLPRVWYNESKLTKHDLQLSQISYSKWLESETVQQTALIHLYTCSRSVSCAPHGGGEGVGVLMCFNAWQRESNGEME